MKNFKQYFTLLAQPEEVYLALTNPATIQLWTGEPTVMSTIAGEEFSLWEGSITGMNLAFEENKKIEQEWYFGEQPQPSIVTIKLHTHKKGTSVELIHTNIPDEAFDDIISGWIENYFGSLEEFYLD